MAPTTARGRKSPFDIALGKRLRQLRMSRDMSMEALGDAIGVSYQQIQKYESGANAIASSRIGAICKTLAITPDVLYDVGNIESKHVAELSPYAIRTAHKLEKLSTDQRRTVTMLLRSFGVEDADAAE